MYNMNAMKDIHFDVLKEIGNIGYGNAIGALSKLLHKPVKMSVPEVKLLEFKEAGNIMGNPEDLVFGVLVSFSGDVHGMMMFLLKPASARLLIDSFLGGHHELGEEFGELEFSGMQEIGNILCSAYLGALATLINKKVIPSAPMVTMDMAAAILSVPAIEFGKVSDKVLFIDSEFDTDNERVPGYFLLVPDMPSLQTILSSLGVM